MWIVLEGGIRRHDVFDFKAGRGAFVAGGRSKTPSRRTPPPSTVMEGPLEKFSNSRLVFRQPDPP